MVVPEGAGGLMIMLLLLLELSLYLFLSISNGSGYSVFGKRCCDSILLIEDMI
jgi:hypothetical protein